MRKKYEHPQIKLFSLTAAERLLSDSQAAGPTAGYMSDPMVSSDCDIKETHISVLSVWDDDWSK